MSKVQSRRRSERRALPGTTGFAEKSKQPVDSQPKTSEVATPLEEKPEAKPESPVDEQHEIVLRSSLTVPIGVMRPGANERPIHVDVRLTRSQSNSLRELLIGLQAVKETCYSRTGKRRLVDSNQDVIRWLLENANRNNPKQSESAR